jgi:hypothetical protein
MGLFKMADARDWSACAWPLGVDVQPELDRIADGRQAPASEAERALATAGARLRVAQAEHGVQVQARVSESESTTRRPWWACCSTGAGRAAEVAAAEDLVLRLVLRQARANLDALESAESAPAQTSTMESAAARSVSTRSLFPLRVARRAVEPEPQALTVEEAEVGLRQAEAALLKPSLLAAVALDGYVLGYAAVELQTDREVLLVAVAQFGLALKHASAEQRADKEVVLTAVQDGGALQYASAELKADKEVVLAAVAQDGDFGGALRYAAAELKADKEFVLAAVTQNGYALQYASEKLRADKDVVLAAVSQDGSALRYASAELKADKEVMLAAVAQNGG